MSTSRQPIVRSTGPARTPKELVDLVSKELRGGLKPAELLILQENPQQWLGLLGVVLADLRNQISDRSRRFEIELGRPQRSADWIEVERAHNAWMRRARFFERLVQVRLTDLRRLVPQDDLHALLVDGCELDGADAHAVKAWQDRVRKVLVQGREPERESPERSKPSRVL